MKVRITENEATGKASQEVVDGVAQEAATTPRGRPTFRVVVDGDLLMPRASRRAVKEYLDGIDLRADVTIDGEPISDYEDVDMWFGPRRAPRP